MSRSIHVQIERHALPPLDRGTVLVASDIAMKIVNSHGGG